MIINFKFTSKDGQEIEGMRTELDRNYDDEETALVLIQNEESDTGGYFELNIYKHKNGSLISDGYVCEYDCEEDSKPAYINNDIKLTVTEHDFDETLTKANEKLKPFGKRIVVDYDGECYWAVGSTDMDGGHPDYYVDADFEHEVQAHIWECLAHVLAKVNDPNLARPVAVPMEKPKVWVVTFINDCEYEMPNVSVNVFGNYDAARKCLDGEWQTLTSEGVYQEDVSTKSDDEFLFVDCCENRTIGEIKEREIRDE